MMGKTHKTIGIVTGAAFSVYGALSGNPLYTLALATAPIGAMIPDIDHNSTTLGRKRKFVFGLVEKLISLGVGITFLFFIIIGLIKGLMFIYVIKALIVLLPFIIATICSRCEWIRKKSRFLTKHRGIMHTLIMPLVIVIGAKMIPYKAISILLLGLAAGYLSHLAADSLTHNGCPIFWPLTEKPVHLTNVKTNTVKEYILAILLSGGILWIPFLLPH